MNKYFLILLLFCSSVCKVNGQKDYTKLLGTISIGKDTSIDATEVTMVEWLQFIVNNNYDEALFPSNAAISNFAKTIFDDVKINMANSKYININKSPDFMKKFLGEILVEENKKELKLLQSQDTNYIDIFIPIVGISFEQAMQFCKWREGTFNKYELHKIKVTLPSVELYKKLVENQDSVNSDGCYNINTLNCSCVIRKSKKKANKEWVKSQGKVLMRADRYWPSRKGLYCLQGNAAEMTFKNGIAVGGSFRQYAIESYNGTIQYYNKPEDWLGFRCLITLLK